MSKVVVDSDFSGQTIVLKYMRNCNRKSAL